MNRRVLGLAAFPAAAALALTLGACGGQGTPAAGGDGVSGEVVVDGSSTVQPLTAAAGELFAAEQPGVNVSVATSGTGGGFEKFCSGETDISNASRPSRTTRPRCVRRTAWRTPSSRSPPTR